MKTLMNTLLVIAATASVAMAGDKPNFSGYWKMDADRSVFGPMPPPQSMTRTIDQKDSEMSFKQSMTSPDMEMTFKYFMDGRETINSFLGSDYKSKTSWDGKTLVIHSRLDGDGPQVTSTSKWTLSDDGKTLTELWTVSSPQGDLAVTYVLVKQ